MSDDLYDGPCEAGCEHFHGGEVRHHRDCGHYPESLTKLWHDTEAKYIARIETLEAENAKLRLMAYQPGGSHPTRCDCIQCVPF